MRWLSIIIFMIILFVYNLKNYYGSIMSCWVVELEHRLHSKKLIKEYHSQTNVDFYLVTTSNLATVKALSAYGWEKMPNKKYDLTTNTNGEHRAFVTTGTFENVFPLDIFPMG